MKNWKTTSAGILAIAGGVINLIYAYINKHITPELIMGNFTAILGGIGLIFAKDFNVTGGQDEANV